MSPRSNNSREAGEVEPLRPISSEPNNAGESSRDRAGIEATKDCGQHRPADRPSIGRSFHHRFMRRNGMIRPFAPGGAQRQ
jgi:hypothetical protein